MKSPNISHKGETRSASIPAGIPVQVQAYSYIRFSSSEQAKGNSLPRQLERSRQFAEQHGWQLDESLVDRGISARSGAHRKKGTALGRFFERIKTGEIAYGSVLIIESLDRLSRERPLDAQMHFMDIIRAGVKVVTLIDKQVYDEESLNTNIGLLFTSLGVMMRSFDESQTKSDRAKDNWQRRLKAAIAGREIFTARGPAWLRAKKDRTGFKVIRERAEVIHQIFEMKAAGDGSASIARRLNVRRDVWHPNGHRSPKGGAWHESYIDRVLRWRAVIGEWQPMRADESGKRGPVGDPVADYFPRIVDEKLFDQVHAILSRNAKIPGRAGGKNQTVANVFGNILRCGHCGGRVRYQNPGKGYGQAYLKCYAAANGQPCDGTWRARYRHLEPALLHLVRALRPSDLLLSEDVVTLNRAALYHHIQELDGKLKQLAKQVDHLTDATADEDDKLVRDTLKKKLSQCLSEQQDLEQQTADLNEEVAIQSDSAEAVAAQMRDMQELIDRMDELRCEARTEQLADIRRRLRHQLHQLVERIDITAKATVPAGITIKMFFRDGAESCLVLDNTGTVRSGYEGERLFWLDEDGNVTDVLPDGTDLVDGDERTKQVNAMIAKALRKQGLGKDKPYLKGH
ncbi:MAG: recombinase family protein [Proteobacteria bacterium]|nr:recombinase family protein [Pseudomonadota bacterium]